MSYDLYLKDANTGEVLHAPKIHQITGGTYALGGTTELHLNITYNYSVHYRMLGEEGIRSIYGMTGAESIPILREAVAQLGEDVSDNYWEPTEGNAKAALVDLVVLAMMRPDGVWDGD